MKRIQKEEISNSISKSWMGAKGFDEAQYYVGEKSDLGLEHSDEKIKAQVEESILRNTKISTSGIEISVQDGIVTLSGNSTSKNEIERNITTIQTLSGVKKVNNFLTYKKS